MGIDCGRFLDPIHGEFICSICLDVFSAPVFCPSCDEHFCGECIRESFATRGSKQCPSCKKTSPIDFQPAKRFVRRLWEQLRMRCQYSENGCSAVMTVEHDLRHIISCKFRPEEEEVPEGISENSVDTGPFHCGYRWSSGEHVFKCRTCEVNRNMALCHECFSKGHHEGHDVQQVVLSVSGGFCDCGDESFLRSIGFCPTHHPKKCGKSLAKNSLAYHCVTCSHKPETAICVSCFEGADHSDHLFRRIVISSDDAWCDCGDSYYMKRTGFCGSHTQ